MTYENVSFNEKFYKGKAFEVFKKNESHHGFSEEQLKEAFEQLNKPPAKEKAGNGKK